MKYSLIIVDDEKYIREGLSRLIDWESENIEIIGYAQNGVEGLELIDKLRPDIVITDVKMKTLDGFGMLEELNRRGVNCKFIVMSGYKVFEYAKKAIDSGVNFYLLKPIETEELLMAINKTKEFLEQDKKDESFLYIERSIVIFKSLYSGTVPPELLGGRPDNYMILNILFDENVAESIQQRMKISMAVKTNTSNAYIDFVKNKHMLCIAFNVEFPRNFTQNFQKLLTETLNSQLVIGASEPFTNFSRMNEAVSQAETALGMRVYTENQDVFHFSPGVIEIEKNRMAHELDSISESIVYNVEICQPDMAHKHIITAVELIKKAQYNTGDVFYWISQIVINIERILKHLKIEITYNDNAMRKLRYECENFIRLEDLLDALCKFCSCCITLLLGDNTQVGFRGLKSVKAYIDNHYMENISLEMMEKIFFAKFSYISHMFKKETGMSYLQYLTGKRINKAKELMADPKLNIYEIANMLSYTDAKYFSQLFKRIEGVTPSEYRRQLFGEGFCE